MSLPPQTVLVVPAFDEAEAIPGTLSELPEEVDRVVVVDGGSRDGTAERARELGAVVVEERRRGYGRACRRGLWVAGELGARVGAIVDAGGTTPPEALAETIRLVRDGEADLALGRRLGLRPWQCAGNRAVLAAAGVLHGLDRADLGPPRVLALEHLAALNLRETGYGWPTELVIRAHQLGLRVAEVPLEVRPRRGGRSKVSGNPLAVPRAGLSMLRTVWRTRRRRHP